MKKISIYSAGFFLVLMNSCSSPARDLAEELCDCLTESGINGEFSAGVTLDKIEDSPCLIQFSEELYDHLSGMNNENRGKFMHEFSKSLLDTDCAELMYQNLPYDELLKSIARTIERRKKSSGDGFLFLKGPSLCDCVNMKDNVDEETREACKEMEKEWKENYARASETEREEIKKEVLECDSK